MRVSSRTGVSKRRLFESALNDLMTRSINFSSGAVDNPQKMIDLKTNMKHYVPLELKLPRDDPKSLKIAEGLNELYFQNKPTGPDTIPGYVDVRLSFYNPRDPLSSNESFLSHPADDRLPLLARNPSNDPLPNEQLGAWPDLGLPLQLRFAVFQPLPPGHLRQGSAWRVSRG